MAKIEWNEEAQLLFIAYVTNARTVFGERTAKRWLKERKNIEWRLERYPESYPLEELLAGRKVVYRRCSMMNRRFKLVYFYDDSKDAVRIVDIWDTRRNPNTLISRL